MSAEETNESLRTDDAGLRRSKTRLERLSTQMDLLVASANQEPVDIQKFVESLTIVNKLGHRVSLIMNRSQELVFHKLLQSREKKIPGRFVCLKSRQLGISTLIEAFIFALITSFAHRSALVVAHSMESAQSIFSAARRFHRFLPRKLTRPLMRDSMRCLAYLEPHSSRMQIDSATNKNLGRGGTLHYVHASEVAFWERPENAVLAINQSVPFAWDTLVFWESTANGVHNLFHRTWIAAERGESDMEPIFLSWKGFPEYSLPSAKREEISMTPEEADYARAFDLTPGQIKWAQHIRVNQCHNSWDKFHQEYPISADKAFIFTGMPWFDQEVIRELLERSCREPERRGFLRFSQDQSAVAELVGDPRGPLEIWQLPDEALSYSLGMDVGEGVGADYTVIQVICNQSRELVARYRSNRVRAETAGLDAYLLGAYYNFGLLGIERNGPGLAALAVCERGLSDYPHMTGYPNLYYHTYTDRKIPEETRRLGWITNRSTKEAMLNRLGETIAGRGLWIFSKTTLLEMQGFVWDAEKKTFRQNYKAPDARLAHDDEIMALAIANEMRTQTWENRFITTRLPSGGKF